jgi:hypothetical protein
MRRCDAGARGSRETLNDARSRIWPTYLRFSARWVELRAREGMPTRRMGGTDCGSRWAWSRRGLLRSRSRSRSRSRGRRRDRLQALERQVGDPGLRPGAGAVAACGTFVTKRKARRAESEAIDRRTMTGQETIGSFVASSCAFCRETAETCTGAL